MEGLREWKVYKKKKVQLATPYIQGENLNGISISPGVVPEEDMGYICTDPENLRDVWYVEKEVFERTMEVVK